MNEAIETDCTNYLTDMQSLCSLSDMAKFKDIVAGLSRQTSRKTAEIADATRELNRLLESYQRYRELSARIEPERESAKIGLALIMSMPVRVNLAADAFDPRFQEETQREMEQASHAVEVDLADLDLSKYPLWKIIREVLRQVPEMRVYELEAHLKTFGVDAERSAIESALNTHRKQFKITKRGREKFVAWKEDWDNASATKERKMTRAAR